MKQKNRILATFPDEKVLNEFVLKNNLAPIRYVDDDDKPTEVYPFNPNGSRHGWFSCFFFIFFLIFFFHFVFVFYSCILQSLHFV